MKVKDLIKQLQAQDPDTEVEMHIEQIGTVPVDSVKRMMGTPVMADSVSGGIVLDDAALARAVPIVHLVGMPRWLGEES